MRQTERETLELGLEAKEKCEDYQAVRKIWDGVKRVTDESTNSPRRRSSQYNFVDDENRFYYIHLLQDPAHTIVSFHSYWLRKSLIVKASGEYFVSDKSLYDNWPGRVTKTFFKGESEDLNKFAEIVEYCSGNPDGKV